MLRTFIFASFGGCCATPCFCSGTSDTTSTPYDQQVVQATISIKSRESSHFTGELPVDDSPSTSPDGTAGASRPVFKTPFRGGQKWLGGNWDGHSPAHSIDWNHYDAGGSPDDFGRRVPAGAGGEVVASHCSTGTGYGNTVVIAHGNGRQTR
ncbi:hypothetical protein [Streptomyces sp. NPDC057496]|uniref:hypothetical protein n=1 Tax=Streptomyces sp. NPDC057496 TaxID=3346149 RepID=UPI0036B1C7F5